MTFARAAILMSGSGIAFHGREPRLFPLALKGLLSS